MYMYVMDPCRDLHYLPTCKLLSLGDIVCQASCGSELHFNGISLFDLSVQIIMFC